MLILHLEQLRLKERKGAVRWQGWDHYDLKIFRYTSRSSAWSLSAMVACGLAGRDSWPRDEKKERIGS